MGKSDPFLFRFYQKNIYQNGSVALLGFSRHTNLFQRGDLYDRSLSDENYDRWNINDDWELPKKYDTIISLRCPYFAKDPELFFQKCLGSLNDGGRFYLDWGLGDHWRFESYKIGWVRDFEQEWAYSEDNLLWSGVWAGSMATDPEVHKFVDWAKRFGYSPHLKKHMWDEIPSIFYVDEYVEEYKILVNNLALWPDSPQLYTLISGIKS